ncbi:MAG: hypothetical protein Kow0032_13780 [Methyloligellaceae bacterium]
MTFLRSMICAALLAALQFLPAMVDPRMALAETEVGIASWYEKGARTANGEPFDPDGLTAAHPTLPFGSVVRVENLRNGRSVVLRINDRGPFVQGRVIDVSRGGARQLGLMASGTAPVRITTLRRGPERNMRAATARQAGEDSLACIIKVCL